jgi:hypothetical protein
MIATQNITDIMSKNIFKQKLTRNYTTIPNDILRNQELSWKAKAIHCYLLSLPETWEVHLNHLKTISTDGYDSTVSGVNELLEKKYLWRRPRSGDEPGGWEYFVYDSPHHECPFGLSESPTREIPDSGNSITINKYNKEEKRTNKINQELSDEEFISDLKKIYDYIDIDVELKRIDAWLLTHQDRKKTRCFVTNWLNRIEKPMPKQKSTLGITEGYRPCL